GLHERQVVQRRAAARHLLVVVSDVLQPLGRDAPAARDVLQKRADLVGLRGAPEGDEKDSVDHLEDISWTMSTSAFTWSTGVSGRTPWPRLKRWQGRPPARRRISATRSRMYEGFAISTTGSRLPWTATSWPTAAQAVSSSTRQSRPITWPPASRMSRSSVAVPVPKWMTGTPGVMALMSSATWGSTNAR